MSTFIAIMLVIYTISIVMILYWGYDTQDLGFSIFFSLFASVIFWAIVFGVHDTAGGQLNVSQYTITTPIEGTNFSLYSSEKSQFFAIGR